MERKHKTWTKEELSYLENKWGELTPDKIARDLGRTVNAIVIKARRLQLGSYLANSEYLNANTITQLMGIESHTVTRIWKKHGFKMTKKKIRGTKNHNVIRFDKLLKWLEEHQELWDSRKVPLYGLGPETEWLKEKRAKDKLVSPKRGARYTPEEDSKIVRMFRKGATQKEIGKAIGRSESSVQARMYRLDLWGTGRLKNAN